MVCKEYIDLEYIALKCCLLWLLKYVLWVGFHGTPARAKHGCHIETPFTNKD